MPPSLFASWGYEIVSNSAPRKGWKGRDQLQINLVEQNLVRYPEYNELNNSITLFSNILNIQCHNSNDSSERMFFALSSHQSAKSILLARKSIGVRSTAPPGLNRMRQRIPCPWLSPRYFLQASTLLSVFQLTGIRTTDIHHFATAMEASDGVYLPVLQDGSSRIPTSSPLSTATDRFDKVPETRFGATTGKQVPISRDQQRLLNDPQSHYKPVQIDPPLAQKQSRFFSRLPQELRSHIYYYVFAPSLIHVLATSENFGNIRLAHLRCNRWLTHGGTWAAHTHGYESIQCTWEVDESQDPNDQLLALCLSCRLLYSEAMPFMLSIPHYTLFNPERVLVVDNTRLHSFRHIRNLHLAEYFHCFPQDDTPERASWLWTDWLIICRVLASMPKLRYLCITIGVSDRVRFEIGHRPERSAELIVEMLEPLKAVDVSGGGEQRGKGVFDLITQDWRMPCQLDDGYPFRVLLEEPALAENLA